MIALVTRLYSSMKDSPWIFQELMTSYFSFWKFSNPNKLLFYHRFYLKFPAKIHPGHWLTSEIVSFFVPTKMDLQIKKSWTASLFWFPGYPQWRLDDSAGESLFEILFSNWVSFWLGKICKKGSTNKKGPKTHQACEESKTRDFGISFSESEANPLRWIICLELIFKVNFSEACCSMLCKRVMRAN